MGHCATGGMHEGEVYGLIGKRVQDRLLNTENKPTEQCVYRVALGGPCEMTQM